MVLSQMCGIDLERAFLVKGDNQTQAKLKPASGASHQQQVPHTGGWVSLWPQFRSGDAPNVHLESAVVNGGTQKLVPHSPAPGRMPSPRGADHV